MDNYFPVCDQMLIYYLNQHPILFTYWVHINNPYSNIILMYNLLISQFFIY